MACVCPCLAAGGFCTACLSWWFHRMELRGESQSEGWPKATIMEVEDFPRTALLIMAAYEEDLNKPSKDFPAEGKELLKRVTLLKKTGYKETQNRYPPYVIAIDHQHKDITFAVRGLNLHKVSEYLSLMDNRKGKQRFNDGYVHRGMLRSAGYLLDDEMDNLNTLLIQHKDYTLTLAGHSLGSGVVSLMTLVILQNLGDLRGLCRDRIRCRCFAPVRSVSLNLAVSVADVISSIVLQDDFLPRMNYPLETIFGFWLCLPCVLQWACCVDFFLPQEKLIQDPRRLYPPGRLYHILYTQGGKITMEETPPEVRVSVPVDGRFEKLIISRTTHADHLLTVIYAKMEKMIEEMETEQQKWHAVPEEQKMQRLDTLRREKREEMVEALERAKTLKVPNAYEPASIPEGEDEEGGRPAVVPGLKTWEEGEGKEEGQPWGVMRVLSKSFGKSGRKQQIARDEVVAGEASGPEGKENVGMPPGSAPEKGEEGAKEAMERQALGRWSRIIDDIISKELAGEKAHTTIAQRRWQDAVSAVKGGILEEQETGTSSEVAGKPSSAGLAAEGGSALSSTAVEASHNAGSPGASSQTPAVPVLPGQATIPQAPVMAAPNSPIDVEHSSVPLDN